MLEHALNREAIQALLRRVDDVRGLSNLPPLLAPTATADAELLIGIAGELVDELERSHRRLIETNVQLLSLREVASSMVGLEGDEATRTVALYLLQALDFDEVFLGLVDRESAELAGTWARRLEDRTVTEPLRAPLTADAGLAGRAVWGHRTIHIRDPRHNPPFRLRGDHPLHEVSEGLGSYVLVPLSRARRSLSGTADACPDRCPFRAGAEPDAYPGPGAESGWGAARDHARRRCLQCPRLPVLGVLGVARDAAAPPVGAPEVTLLESVGLSVAPVIENARLYQDLRRGQQFLDDVLNSMMAAVVAIEGDGRVRVFNRAAEEITGRRAEDVHGADYAQVFDEEARRLVEATLSDGREFLRQETWVRGADGAEVPVSLTTSRLRDERGQAYGAIATFLDLTRVRRMEERIRQLDRLAAIGRFTASVAHEIRNPLAGISAGVEYLRKGFPAGGEQQAHVQFIQNEIARLDRIIGDLFTVSHPKALQPRRTPVGPLLTRALQSVQTALDERGARLEWTVPETVPPVPVDPDQMQQVFINLLKNAAEASPPGGRIRVQAWTGIAEPEGLGPSAGLAVHVQIEDEGAGIPAEQRAHLFEPFFTTKPGGTGLGLYVCYDIVKRHGGALRVRPDEPGRGACFTVELPLEPLHGGCDVG